MVGAPATSGQNASVEMRDFDLLRAPRRRILRGKSRGRGGGFLTSAGLIGSTRETRSTVVRLLGLTLCPIDKTIKAVANMGSIAEVSAMSPLFKAI
jgi:hypothetical protein